MFTVELYTVNKQVNSTALPTGTALSLSCLLKSPSSVQNPVLEIDRGAAWNPSAYNYARIPDFNRYYWIKDWTWSGGLWTAALQVDALASWRTAIGDTTAYVYRSAAESNLAVFDNTYPIIAEQTVYNVTVDPIIHDIAGLSNGFYVVGIIANNGTRYWGFSWSMLQDFIQAIYSDTYVSSILSTYSLDLYPEAKIAVDPTQYISSIRWYPCRWGNGSGNTISVGYREHAIPVGPSGVEVEAYNFGELTLDYSSLQVSTQHITIGTGAPWVHPQHLRGNYLRLAPYASYQLFLPPFGIIDLDPVEIYRAATLDIQKDIDLKTGIATLSVNVIYPNDLKRTIARVNGIVGIDMPLSNIVQVGTTNRQYWANVWNHLSDPFNLGSYQQDVVKNTMNGEIPHLFQAGGQGNASDFFGDPGLYITYRHIADEDLADRGRPLYTLKTLNTIPGYIECDPGEFSAAGCTESETQEIKSRMREGFYYA